MGRNLVAVNCAYCGEKRRILPCELKENNFCNQSCTMKFRLRRPEDHPHWKGGKRTNHNGYIEIRLPGHHRARKNGYVFEHILVAEAKLGRRLLPNEHVHHINEIKTDNRSDNLMVVDIREHSKLHGKGRRKGQTLKCVVCQKEYYRKPSHAKKSKCCSLKCVGLYTQLKLRGEI